MRHPLEQVKSITSKHITEIQFWYWLGEEEEPSSEVWKDLDVMLSTDVFKPLIRVDVACVFRDSEYDWCEVDHFEKSKFPTLLPNLSKRGILTY